LAELQRRRPGRASAAGAADYCSEVHGCFVRANKKAPAEVTAGALSVPGIKQPSSQG
jgi:hypothetical protein